MDELSEEERELEEMMQQEEKQEEDEAAPEDDEGESRKSRRRIPHPCWRLDLSSTSSSAIHISITHGPILKSRQRRRPRRFLNPGTFDNRRGFPRVIPFLLAMRGDNELCQQRETMRADVALAAMTGNATMGMRREDHEDFSYDERDDLPFTIGD
ncbi:hypothetical protein ARMGADRAFT_1091894 [Armillaria gallica]|uniref:Uncharacterized protein n=1 Tax=Armillaria gallica TaxID=47427 RepID=A0A2H3CFW1_ARMGA|nr:hypothetical protein ARMGADRAFT_1091894 [Armillaria gallica]